MTPEERASEAMRLHFCHSDLDAPTIERIQQVMRRQIQLAQEDEREECAKTAEMFTVAELLKGISGEALQVCQARDRIADGIRARGKV